MNAARRAGLDEEVERVYLTILAHVDAQGLATQCSWTDIMDYASIGKPDIARAAIRTLESASIVKQDKNMMRKPIFRVLGRFADDVMDARRFQMENQERVNGLKNSRTSAYSTTKNGRNGGTIENVVISDLKYFPAMNAEKPDRWRFTAYKPGYGSVSNCVYIAYTHKTPEVKGPSWRFRKDGNNEDWLYPVEWEPEVYKQIFVAVSEAIEQVRKT